MTPDHTFVSQPMSIKMNGFYFRCLNSARLISVISPTPEIFLISMSLRPMAREVSRPLDLRGDADGFTGDFLVDFIKKRIPPDNGEILLFIGNIL